MNPTQIHGIVLPLAYLEVMTHHPIFHQYLEPCCNMRPDLIGSAWQISFEHIHLAPNTCILVK